MTDASTHSAAGSLRTPATPAITVIPGDGIGPEVTSAVLRVFEAAGARADYDYRAAGVTAVSSHGSPFPQETRDSIGTNRLALKGPLTTPSGSGFRSVNVSIRKAFELFANIRPVRTLLPGGRYEDIDLVLIRENTEGLYVGVEHYIGMERDPKAAAESVMITTRFGSERIVRFAFEYALGHGRRKVTMAHKANILKHTQGLFLDAGKRIAADYEGRVAFEDRIVDATAMYLVLDPYRFDVLVTENMFGDILSDLMAGLVGGHGLCTRRQHWREPCRVRSGSRIGTGYRRLGGRQPNQLAAGRLSAVGSCRSGGGRCQDPRCRLRGHPQRRGPHPRHGRQGHDRLVYRRCYPRTGMTDDLRCSRCKEVRPASELDRVLWCEGCVAGAKGQAKRIGWIFGAALAIAFSAWIRFVQRPSDIVIGGWIGAVLATLWLGARVGKEAGYGFLRFRHRPR